MKFVVVFCLLGLAAASPLGTILEELEELVDLEDLVELEAWEVMSKSIIVDKFFIIKFLRHGS